ncbi:MAG: helix-turn-helix transcriptional regulator, partial [Blautia sp.]|nr:helix-turn-helix transcriptional regulator [Blautia sp.]
VTLQSLSEKYSYNSDYISRQIRRATGKTFKDYLLDRRMEAVCSALKNTSLPISEIESEAGFQNETYFYKQFRRKYGMTPNEYRGMPV